MQRFRVSRPALWIISISIISALMYISLVLYPTTEKSEYKIPEQDFEYAQAVRAASPEITVVDCNHPSALPMFSNGENVALYDTQAYLLSDVNTDYTFQPHYTQTVVIAIDRMQTDEAIESFAGLLTTELSVGFDLDKEVEENMWEYPKTHQVIIAMAKALYGTYDIKSVSKDINLMIEQDRFLINDLTTPVIVTHDSTAVQLIKSGRDLEIVIPVDGTLSFDFGAFVSTDNIKFNDDLPQQLIKNGYRLPNGGSDLRFYPDEKEYSFSEHVVDMQEFNYATTLVAKELRREGFDTMHFGFVDTKEMTIFYLVLLFVLMFYLVNILHRVSDKRVGRLVVVILALLLFFITIGLLKSLNSHNAVIETILWYLSYIPILVIPAVFVKISLNSEQNVMRHDVDRVFIIYFILILIPLFLIFTNGLHGMVFEVYDYYETVYDYNIAFLIVIGCVYASIIFAYIILIYKNYRLPKKLTFVYPLLIGILVSGYLVARYLEISPAVEFDLTFAITIVILLYIECCILSRFFPVNTGYNKLFMHSGLAMEIKDKKNNIVFKSLTTKDINENFIKRTTAITGGSFSYFEDYTSLNVAQAKLAKTNDEMRKNNEFLLQNASISAELSAVAVERAVYDSIDDILLVGTERIENLIDQLKQNKNDRKTIVAISVQAGIMKRECMLRINALHQEKQSVTILLGFLNEIKELVEGIGLSITAGCTISGDLSIDNIIAVYQFYTKGVERAISLNLHSLLVQLYENDEEVVFSMLADSPLFDNEQFEILKKRAEGFTVISKSWDNSESYLLGFKKGGSV